MSVAAIKPRKWSREEYDRLIEQGVFQEDERLELIEGEILAMTPQDARHAGSTNIVYEALDDALVAGYCLRVQLPLALGEDSEPEPDVAVVAGSARDFLQAHPETAALVVEVADSSLLFDRRRKLPLYARSGIPEVWIVNVVEGRLEVHRKPEGGGYREHEVLTRGDRVACAVLREAVAVADLLP
jgi:Uma2 family endonuclease